MKAKEGKKIIYDTPLMDLTLQFKDSAKILYESEVERLKLLKTIKTQLPRKQLALLNLLLEGKTVKEIAAEWGDKPPTVYALRTRTVRRIKDIILKLKQSQENGYRNNR